MLEGWSEVQITIAHQIHNTKPAALVPGRDVGMEPISDDTLRVLVNRPERKLVDVRYDRGRDTYVLTTRSWWQEVRVWGEAETLDDVYCDQLGELIFGSEAEPFTLPMVRISTDDGETWETIA